MSTKVFDELTLFYDAEVHGTFTVGVHNSASVDLGAADVDELNAGEIIAKWPGLDSAGAMTVVVSIQDSADDSSFATIWSSETFDLAGAKAAFDDWRFRLPTKDLRRYVRVSVVIGVDVASAGVLTMGLVK